MTAQACLEPEGVMEQATAYISALQDAAAYRVAEAQLEIENTAGEPILLFKLDPRADVNPADLVGTRWQLVTLNVNSPLEGSTLTLHFESENEYRGHAGCRDFIGSYEAEDDAITFSSMSMLGDDACLANEALFDQEHTYILNYPNAICRHINPADKPLEQRKTIATIIMDLTTLEMPVCWGNPCTAPFRTYSLED